MSLVVDMTLTGNADGAKRAAEVAGKSVEELKQTTTKYGAVSKSATEDAQRGYQAVRSSIDPLYRSELQLKEAQDKLNAAVRAGVTTQAESADISAELVGRHQALAASMNDTSNRAQSGGIRVENMSAAISGLATDAASGTISMTSLGQTIPLLLGGFGALGTIVGAVVVGLGEALVRALFDTKEELVDLDTTLDDLEGAVTDFTTITDRSLQPLRALREEYGLVDDQLRSMLESQRELARVNAQADLDAVGTGLAEVGGLSGVEGALENNYAGYGGNILLQQVSDLGEGFEITTDGAAALQRALIDLNEAGSDLEGAEAAEATRAAFAETYDIVLDLFGGYDDLTDTQRELLGQILKGEEAATRLLGTTQKLPEGVAAAAAAAGLMALNFRNALDYASQIDSVRSTLLMRETDGALQDQYGDDRVGLAGAQAGAGFDRSNPIGRGQSAAVLAERASLRERTIALARRDAERAASRSAGGGGVGGGGASATNAEAAAIQKLIAGLEDEIELLGELDPVNQEMISLRDKLVGATEAEIEAVRALIIARNEEREAMEASIERLDTIRSIGEQVWSDMRAGIRENATGAQILLDIFTNIGNRMSDLAGNALMDALFGQSGSSDGGAIGGVLSDWFGSLFQFADGGVVNGPTMFGFNNGQTGLMGEAGPEAIMPLTHGGASQGVGAMLGGRETTLPLTRLNSGKLGVEIRPFANGGIFGAANRPIAPRSQASEPAASERRAAGGHGGVTNFYISTPDPRKFAENRATASRGASRLLGQMGRFT